MLLLHHELQARAALERERVQRDVIGRERHDLPHGVLNIRSRLARQPEDEIHIDVRDARRAQGAEHLDDLCRRMAAADAHERLFLHGLRIDAHARDAERTHRLDLGRGHAVGPSRFHRELPAGRAIKCIIYQMQHFGKKIVRQARRRAAADIDVLHGEAVAAHSRLRRCEILAEYFHEDAQLRLARQDIRGERAVETAREAERDADIDAHGLLRRRPQERQLAERHGHDELRLFPAARIVPLQPLDDGRLVKAARNPAMDDLRRTHAMQYAPGSLGHTEMTPKDMVKSELEDPVERRHLALIGSAAARLLVELLRAVPAERVETHARAHASGRIVRQAAIDDGKLCVVREGSAAHDLDLEEIQHLFRDLRQDFLGGIYGECLNLHCFA